MEIESSFTHNGKHISITYRDIYSRDEIGESNIKGVHAWCFYADKLVLVYAESKGTWGPPGGGVEKGETVEEAVVREVLEETNMRVLKQNIIGYSESFEPERALQTRSVCIVEPCGEFTQDPDGDITEIKLIDPSDYKKYFDWGVTGDHIMKRALGLKEQMRS